jgi:hypothetical protein
LDLTGVRFTSTHGQTLQQGQWVDERKEKREKQKEKREKPKIVLCTNANEKPQSMTPKRVFECHPSLVVLRLPFSLMQWAVDHGFCSLSRLQHLDISRDALPPDPSDSKSSANIVHSILSKSLPRIAEAISAFPQHLRSQTAVQLAALRDVPGWNRSEYSSILVPDAPFHLAVDVELLLPLHKYPLYMPQPWLTAAGALWALPGCALTLRHRAEDNEWHLHDAPLTVWDLAATPSVRVVHIVISHFIACGSKLEHVELAGIPCCAALIGRLAYFPLKSLRLCRLGGERSLSLPSLEFRRPCSTVLSANREHIALCLHEMFPHLRAVSLDGEIICEGVLLCEADTAFNHKKVV